MWSVYVLGRLGNKYQTSRWCGFSPTQWSATNGLSAYNDVTLKVLPWQQRSVTCEVLLYPADKHFDLIGKYFSTLQYFIKSGRHGSQTTKDNTPGTPQGNQKKRRLFTPFRRSSWDIFGDRFLCSKGTGVRSPGLRRLGLGWLAMVEVLFVQKLFFNLASDLCVRRTYFMRIHLLSVTSQP